MGCCKSKADSVHESALGIDRVASPSNISTQEVIGSLTTEATLSSGFEQGNAAPSSVKAPGRRPAQANAARGHPCPQMAMRCRPEGSSGCLSSLASADGAAYLAERILDEEWSSQHTDVAYYCKAPMAFLEVGSEETARAALDIAVKAVSEGSANEWYNSMYPQYPYLWICNAASRLGRMDVAKRCFHEIVQYMHPLTNSGLVAARYHWGDEFEACFFATAVVCKAAALVGDIVLSHATADSMLRTLTANRRNMRLGLFRLRWKWSTGFVEDDEPHYCVRQHGDGQLYHMLGLPAAILLELGCAGDIKYGDGGHELLNYLRGCDSLFSSPYSHQVACAAAFAKDNETAARIVDHVLSLQRDGCFHEDREAMEAVDLTAEIICCLKQVNHNSSGGRTFSQPSSLPPSPPHSGETSELETSPRTSAGKVEAKACTVESCFEDSTKTDTPAKPAPPASSTTTDAAQATAKRHVLERCTFGNPTWCKACGVFLWGLRDQGLRNG
mmetsp:Transcript_118657/g.335602  ORF Transcript_118657/g.335602 Transcript_118657/m.335602 type:complete len:500 (-) Transcript_118657:826-2325(-)